MKILQNGTENAFVTSDWHLGHDKSIMYDKRPFTDIQHMHRVLINNYNATVGPHDICYFLGDIGWHDAGFDLIQKLNGKKILILGNHDKGKQKMYKMGFDLVLNGAMVTLGKSIITMSHCPLRGVFREAPINQDGEVMKNFTPGDNWHGESRHDAFSFPNFGQFHLHGHTHKRKENDVQSGKQWDIGVVGNGYRPVSFSQIEAWIATFHKSNPK
jgi:calcineurin-like phosphoesterase family protein